MGRSSCGFATFVACGDERAGEAKGTKQERARRAVPPTELVWVLGGMVGSVADGAGAVEDNLGRGVGFPAMDSGEDVRKLGGDIAEDGGAAGGDAVLGAMRCSTSRTGKSPSLVGWRCRAR
jgi:hypothetical protein